MARYTTSFYDAVRPHDPIFLRTLRSLLTLLAFIALITLFTLLTKQVEWAEWSNWAMERLKGCVFVGSVGVRAS